MIGLPEKSLPWAIPFDAVTMLAAYEQGPAGGVALRAYRCPAGIPTIGWGKTDGVKMGDRCTKDEADRWLCADVADRANRVRAMCTDPPGDNELAALVVLAYNIGLGGLSKSTVMRQHNAGNRQAAARAFSLWNKVSTWGYEVTAVGVGVFLIILLEAAIRRRKAEANPWGEGATTLEWTLSSPPPFHQFNELPVIKPDAH